MQDYVAHAPGTEFELTPQVDGLSWDTKGDRKVALIPGWSAHPRFYGHLIEALLREDFGVLSSWPRPGARDDAHYRALPQLFAKARADQPEGLLVVAESLGATFALASGLLGRTDRVCLIAPGLLLKPSVVLSLNSLRSLYRLTRSDSLEIDSRMLGLVSDNTAYLTAIKRSGLLPAASSRAYVVGAVLAAARALVLPRGGGVNWLIHGEEDRLVSQIGTRVLAHRLPNAKLTLIPEAAHGVLWDTGDGGQLASSITSFMKGSRDGVHSGGNRAPR